MQVAVGYPGQIVAENVDFLERRSRRQHLEQLGIETLLSEAEMQRIKRHLAGGDTANDAADAQALLVAKGEIVKSKQLSIGVGELVQCDERAVGKLQPEKVRQRRQIDASRHPARRQR